jgi:signal peptidase I
VRQNDQHPERVQLEPVGIMMPVKPAFRADLHALKCELASDVLRSSGRLRLRVTGWSMLPTIFPGDTVMIERASGENVCEGDIVLFDRDRRLFVHRVSGKSGSTGDLRIVTQGDAMTRPDPPVSGSQVLGKVRFVLRDGRLSQPATCLGFSSRAVAALVRRSSSAARVIVAIRKSGSGTAGA